MADGTEAIDCRSIDHFYDQSTVPDLILSNGINRLGKGLSWKRAGMGIFVQRYWTCLFFVFRLLK